MPYKVKTSGEGYKVFSPNGPKSKKSMTLRQAKKQQAAIYANTKEVNPKTEKKFGMQLGK